MQKLGERVASQWWFTSIWLSNGQCRNWNDQQMRANQSINLTINNSAHCSNGEVWPDVGALDMSLYAWSTVLGQNVSNHDVWNTKYITATGWASSPQSLHVSWMTTNINIMYLVHHVLYNLACARSVIAAIAWGKTAAARATCTFLPARFLDLNTQHMDPLYKTEQVCQADVCAFRHTQVVSRNRPLPCLGM